MWFARWEFLYLVFVQRLNLFRLINLIFIVPENLVRVLAPRVDLSITGKSHAELFMQLYALELNHSKIGFDFFVHIAFLHTCTLSQHTACILSSWEYFSSLTLRFINDFNHSHRLILRSQTGIGFLHKNIFRERHQGRCLQNWQNNTVKEYFSSGIEFSLISNKLSEFCTAWNLNNFPLLKTGLANTFHCNEFIRVSICILIIFVFISTEPIELLILSHY